MSLIASAWKYVLLISTKSIFTFSWIAAMMTDSFGNRHAEKHLLGLERGSCSEQILPLVSFDFLGHQTTSVFFIDLVSFINVYPFHFDWCFPGLLIAFCHGDFLIYVVVAYLLEFV